MALLRGPFADPRFRRLLAGQSLSSFGDTALYLTLGIWAKALTGSNAAAGGVFLALGIPALFAPAAGHLADRVRRRPLLIWANALTAALVLSLLAVHSRSQLWIIYLVAFGYGVSFGVLGSGFAGLQKDLLPGPDLAAANAALTSIGYGLRIVAPLAGAGLFTAFGGGAWPLWTRPRSPSRSSRWPLSASPNRSRSQPCPGRSAASSPPGSGTCAGCRCWRRSP
jgi:MFS family permease